MLELELENPPSQATGQNRLTDSPGTPRLAHRTCSVLVVDDEEGVREVLKIWLRQQGFAVWLAADGQAGLDLYRRHRGTIDVVLLDVQMPGLDGPQTLAALQVLNPQVRCCFMSGDLGSYTEEGLRNRGAAAILPKPFRLAEVARVLRQLSGQLPRPVPHARVAAAENVYVTS